MSGFPNAQNNPGAAIPVYIAGSSGGAVVPVPPTPIPATLAASGVYTSGIIPGGYNKLAAAITSTQVGAISIQRYIDPAGTIALGASISQTLTANAPATVWVNDGQPFAAWQVTITNTSGSTATLSGGALLETN